MKKTIRRSNWNTYALRGYTSDVANCQRSAGGVHIYEVRLGKNGWMKRICQSNGFKAYSAVTNIDDIEGESLFEMAKTY